MSTKKNQIVEVVLNLSATSVQMQLSMARLAQVIRWEMVPPIVCFLVFLSQDYSFEVKYVDIHTLTFLPLIS